MAEGETSASSADALDNASCSDSPEKSDEPSESASVATSTKPSQLCASYSPSLVDTAAQPRPRSGAMGEPLLFGVQFTPSLTAEERRENATEIRHSPANETLSSPDQEEEEAEEKCSDDQESNRGVGEPHESVIDQLTSSSCMESEPEEHQVENRTTVPVGDSTQHQTSLGSLREGTSENTRALAVSDSTQHRHQTTVSRREGLLENSHTLPESAHHPQSTPVSSNTTDSFSPPGTASPSLTHNTQDTYTHNSAISTQIATSTAEGAHSHSTSSSIATPTTTGGTHHSSPIATPTTTPIDRGTHHSSPIATPTTTPIDRGTYRSSPIATPTATGAHSLSTDLSVSPYVVVRGEGASGMVEVLQFESPGLLYAKSTKERHNLDMLKPPDEVAEDVLEMIEEEDPVRQQLVDWAGEREEDDEEEEERDGDWESEERERADNSTTKQVLRITSKTTKKAKADGSSTTLDSSDDGRAPLEPLDPKVLRDVELQARKVAASLDFIMDNLHHSLHAMTVCTKQSVMLHREAVENLHTVVDNNVKATYCFLAKFEELKRHTPPLDSLSHQIKDINKILKVLERSFRTP